MLEHLVTLYTLFNYKWLEFVMMLDILNIQRKDFIDLSM